MPACASFDFLVCVGSYPLWEYVKDGSTYVEASLSTPVSFNTETTGVVNGETEKQNIPATPYTIKVTHSRLSGLKQAYFRIFVDGVKVKSLSLPSGKTREVFGFKEGTATKEFLFSLPKMTKEKGAGVTDEQVSGVGRVTVECWEAKLKKSKHQMRFKTLAYKQATKNDVEKVTKGEYTMSTTKVGRVVFDEEPLKLINHWQRTKLVDTLTIQYHMGHTLMEMGFTVRPIMPVSRQNGTSSKPEDEAKDKEKDSTSTAQASNGAEANLVPRENGDASATEESSLPNCTGHTGTGMDMKEEEAEVKVESGENQDKDACVVSSVVKKTAQSTEPVDVIVIDDD